VSVKVNSLSIVLLVMLGSCFFAVGLQNVVQAVFIAYFLFIFAGKKIFSFKADVTFKPGAGSSAAAKLQLASGIGFLLLIVVSNVPEQQDFDTTARFFLGWMGVFLFPCFLTYLDQGQMDLEKFSIYQLRLLVAFGVLLLGLIIFQKMTGMAYFEGAWQFERYRPHGPYSHPLTFAYVLLLFTPIALYFHKLRPSGMSLFFLMVNLAGLVVTESRVCQVIGLIILIFWLFRVAKKKVTTKGLLLAVAGISILALSDNPVKRKFIWTIEYGQERVRDGEVPFERIIFWQAHWELFKEKPVFGHGLPVSESVRKHGYEKIGRAEFPRKYAAHNLYLEILVGSGAVGLALFLAWMSALFRIFWKQRDCLAMLTGLLVTAALAVGSLTQNTLFDSEVRHTFMVLLMSLVFMKQDYKNKAESLVSYSSSLRISVKAD
jgi:O-antigen ligase